MTKAEAQTNDSPFLSGNYAPVHDELTFERVDVIGKLPDALAGTYYRNGPNPIFPAQPYHWFDGDGMIHAVTVQGGKASYRNRFVQTVGLREETAAGKSLYPGIYGGPPFKNAANTALAWHADKLLALWEGGEPYRLAPGTIDTEGAYDFDGAWDVPFTAHPKIDQTTGEMVVFGYDQLNLPHMHYGVVDALGQVVHKIPVHLPHPVMMHDFAITRHFSVFLDLPEVYVPGKGLEFKPELGARLGVIPRHGQASDIRWFKVKPCWVFHVANAYEVRDSIVLIGSRYEQYPRLGAAVDRAQLYRWTLNLESGAVQEEAIGEHYGDFPRVDDRRAGQPTRFTYISLDRAQGQQSGVAKCDTETGAAQVYHHGPGRAGGEMEFVPRPGGEREDDGWVMGLVYDSSTNRSELVVLAAADMTPVARVMIPARVPFGFHGLWVARS